MSLRAIFYDTETTGLKSESERIIELAAFDPATGKTFHELINPLKPIPAEASAIHHITNEMVKDKPTFDKVAHDFMEFCAGDTVLIAHNNDGFDVHFLKAEFERAHIPFPIWKFIDSLKWARRYRPDLPRHPLQYLREIYCIEQNKAHRALDDVMVLHRVFSHMTDDLSIEDIYNLLNKPKAIQHMPFGKYQGTPLKKVPKDYIDWLTKSGAFDKPENSELKKAFEQLSSLEPASV